MFRLVLLLALIAAPALAQEAQPSTGGALIGRLFNSLSPRHAPDGETADFVRQSRPGVLKYRPFDPTPDKVDRRKTAAEMQRISTQLEAAAAANRQKAARVKVPH